MSRFNVIMLSNTDDTAGDWLDVEVEADSEAEARTAAEDSNPGFFADGAWALD